MMCSPYTKYSSLPEVPLELLRSKRGYRGCPFRMITKKSGKGEECRGCEIRSAVKAHMESDLHVRCEQKEEMVKTERKTFDQENKDVGKTVILTYIS